MGLFRVQLAERCLSGLSARLEIVKITLDTFGQVGKTLASLACSAFGSRHAWTEKDRF
jgi:hypothetical protein